MRLSIWDRLSYSFNSRTPGGVRLLVAFQVYLMFLFQFTHPGRGATHPGPGVYRSSYNFQFTHPGRGETQLPHSGTASRSGFNSRTPGGVRREIPPRV